MTQSRVLPLVLAMGAAFAVPAQAESLLQLYEAARAQDAAWQSAQAQYDASVYRAAQSRAGILPAANLGASRSITHLENNNPPTDRSFGALSVTLSGSQPLYRPVNWYTWLQGERQAELARHQLSLAAQDLIIRVSQAYFDVLSAQDTLAFVRAQKTAVSEQLASARRNFEVGTATITDTREAQARYDLVQAQEIAAENELRVRKLALDSLVGRVDAQPDALATPLVLPSPQPEDPQQWVVQAEQSSPQILQARTAIEIAQLETEKAKAGHKPTVDLTASHTATRNINGTSTGAVDSRPRSTTVAVQLNLPLFAGYATQNRIRETIALEQKAQADLEATRRTIAQAVRTAYFGVVSGQNQVRALESAEASSQSALDANRLGYQVGVRINIDVLNAQSQLFQTKRDLAVARYNVLLGHLRLRQANGTLGAEDLARMSALASR